MVFCLVAYGKNPSYTQRFHGIDGEALKNVTERAQVYQQDAAPLITPEDVQNVNEQTLIDIKDGLAAFGYFKPQIKSTITKRNNTYIFDYWITPGPLLHINRLDLRLAGEGLHDPAFQELLANFPLHQGDVVRSKFYQEAKGLLLDLAAQRGYFSAKMVKSTILIDLSKYTATVIIYYDTGPRYYFGRVTFSPSPYATCFLSRYIPFCYGKPYQNKWVMRLQEYLANSNFFQQVTVTPKPEAAEGLLVPIEVGLVPRKPAQYSFGLGFGTDTGPRALLGAHFRRLNPYGHTMDLVVQASQRVNRVQANYTIPGRHPYTDSYRISAAAEQENLPATGKSRYENFEVSQIKKIGKWVQTASLSLRDEHSQPVDAPSINSTMLLPNLNWTKVKSDDPLSPNHGYQINLNIRGASRALISNTDFLQGLVQGKYLTTFGSDTRLITKGQLGYTLISDIDELPLSLRFYTGGAQTVRGYKYLGIGPGRTLIMGSIELQQRIKGNLYGAVFFDAGSVSNTLAGDLKKSIGVGVVWRSPIGAIEATVAQALDLPGHPRMLQFSMGPEL